MNVERADDHGRDRITGDAQRQHRHIGTAHRGVVGRLGRDQPLVSPLTKGARWVLHRAPGMVVGHQGGDVPTGPRHRPHHHADAGGAGGQPQMPAHQRPGRHDPLDILAHGLLVQRVHLHQHFSHAEQADHGDDVGNAGRQLQTVEGQARLARHRIEADTGHQRTQRRREDALGQRFARQAADQQHAPDRQQQVFTRPELQGQRRDRRRRQRQRQDADETAIDRHHRAQADGLPRLAEPGQRITIHRRGNGRRGTGNVEQDRRARPAIDAPQKDPGDQRQRLVHRPLEGEGDQDRHRHRHRQPGDGTDVDAGKGAQRGQHHQLAVQPADKKLLQDPVHLQPTLFSAARPAATAPPACRPAAPPKTPCGTARRSAPPPRRPPAG